MKLPEDKVLEALESNLADYRYNEVSLVHRLSSMPYVIHEKLWNTIIAYIYMQSRRYEAGIVRSDLYEIIRVCKKIKEYALDDELSLPSYAYGELPKPIEYISP
jgi:hypothetical protein